MQPDALPQSKLFLLDPQLVRDLQQRRRRAARRDRLTEEGQMIAEEIDRIRICNASLRSEQLLKNIAAIGVTYSCESGYRREQSLYPRVEPPRHRSDRQISP
jgi:hypothetical protein